MATQDNQLVILLENMLLTPTSDFYISTILHNPDGSSADPFTAKSVGLGNVAPKDAGFTVDVTLTDLLVKGLSNVQVILNDGKPAITVDGNTVTFDAKLPNTQSGYTRPSDVPDKIEMSGKLDVSIDGGALPTGTITVTVGAVAKVMSSFIATEGTAGKLSTVNIDVQSIKLAPGTETGNIDFNIKLDTKFSGTINSILNQSDTQNSLIAQVNSQINQPATLKKLSDVATSKARAALASN